MSKIFEPGDVLLAQYPFTSHATTKLRPVLVVSKASHNQHGDFVTVPISSKTESPISRQHGYLIKESDPCFGTSGLRRSSTVRWSKPMTISDKVIHRKIGTLPEPIVKEITDQICAMLAGQG